MSDAGRLHGEIPLGYYRVRRAIEELDGLPAPSSRRRVLHIILSHHGSLEHGSPVVPCTREATLVHMIDNLGGRLGSFDRLEKELPAGEQWSAFDKAIGGGAYFAGARAKPHREAGAEPGRRRDPATDQPQKTANSARSAGSRRSAVPAAQLQLSGMAKDTEKLIRQLSLISYLMAERRPVTAPEIRRDVEGYSVDERGRVRAPLLRRPLRARGAGDPARRSRSRSTAWSSRRPTRCRPRTSTCRRSSSPTRSWRRCAPRCSCSTASSPTPSRCAWRSSRSPGAGPAR